jgi:flagellar hook-basal body complex protein FliE
MISPINAFDVGTIQAGQQAGMQRGAVNSPFTALGTALKSTLDKYQASQVAAQEQANAMALQGSKNDNDIAVAKIGAGYTPDGSSPLPETTPEVVWTKGPNGEDMYATKKTSKGRPVQSDFVFAPKPASMKSQLEDKALGPIVANWGKDPSVGAPQIPTAQTTPQGNPDPAKFKKQVNTKTGEVRYVPR